MGNMTTTGVLAGAPSATPDVRVGAEVAALAVKEVGVATLRVGLALAAIAAATDMLFAIASTGGPHVGVGVEGILLTALPLGGIARLDVAARLLLPRGAPVVLAGLFALAGAIDWGLQLHYAEVAPTILVIAVIVSSRPWALLAALVSAGGYLADVALQGHSLTWMFVGAGQEAVANQLIDLAMNAVVVLVIVGLLRHFLAGTPDCLSRARDGGATITPQLAIAVRQGGELLLGRANPIDVIAPLSPAERRVLALLADGHAPKQAANELTVTLATVRSHIASAKRKTGARTLEQLVALYSEGTYAG